MVKLGYVSVTIVAVHPLDKRIGTRFFTSIAE